MPSQPKLWYTVHEDYAGEISMSSFMGKTIAEERRFALTTSRHVFYIGRDRDQAQRIATQKRNEKAANQV